MDSFQSLIRNNAEILDSWISNFHVLERHVVYMNSFHNFVRINSKILVGLSIGSLSTMYIHIYIYIHYKPLLIPTYMPPYIPIYP